MAYLRFNVCLVSKAPDANGVRAESWVIVKNESGCQPVQVGSEYLVKLGADVEAMRLAAEHGGQAATTKV
jgi:hypothetical protein